ncbi:MAG: sensor histidine kinase, partial [Hyphomicrobiales bacterium]
FNRMIAELEKRQEQLVQAQKLSSIGIMASGIAHQLNNPLNNISTSLQILSEEFGHGDPDFSKRLLSNCLLEILRAQEIVKGLLEFSRQREFALRTTQLSDVVERALRLISSQVPAGIEIKADIPPDIQLDMDSQRMQEVLLNLLMNATQAIEELPGQIRVSARPATTAEQKPVIEIVVEDTGKGIDPKDIGKIFDPFFTTKEVGAGTGLGLSIVYGIIEKHRGSIAVQSRPGEGTRFIIRLPVTQDPERM